MMKETLKQTSKPTPKKTPELPFNDPKRLTQVLNFCQHTYVGDWEDVPPSWERWGLIAPLEAMTVKIARQRGWPDPCSEETRWVIKSFGTVFHPGCWYDNEAPVPRLAFYLPEIVLTFTNGVRIVCHPVLDGDYRWEIREEVV